MIDEVAVETTMPAPGSPEWHAIRAQGIGASEIPGVLGRSPFANGSALAVYLQKITPPDQLAGNETTEEMARGNDFEEPLARKAARLYGWNLVRVPTQVHPDNPIFRASPDRMLLDEAGNPVAFVEVKTSRSEYWDVDGINFRVWGDPEEDCTACPEHVLLQVQYQMAVGVNIGGKHHWPTRAYVIACVGNIDDFRCYRIDRDEELGRALLVTAKDFWDNHIVPRVPPAFDGSEAGDEILKVMYPKETRPDIVSVRPGSDLEGVLVELVDARRARAEAQEVEEALAQTVKNEIGENAGLDSAVCRVLWKASKDREVVDWHAAFKDMQSALTDIVGMQQASDLATMLTERHTDTRPGSRSFRVTAK